MNKKKCKFNGNGFMFKIIEFELEGFNCVCCKLLLVISNFWVVVIFVIWCIIFYMEIRFLCIFIIL